MVWDEMRYSAFPFTAFDLCAFPVVKKQQEHFILGSSHGGQADARAPGRVRRMCWRLRAGPSWGARGRSQFWSELALREARV